MLDLHGVNEELLRSLGPVYQWVLQHVKPERALNKRASYRDFWWLPGEPRPELRRAIQAIERYLVTPMVAKHRYLELFPSGYIPDQKLVVVATNDAFVLGVLSARIHCAWALAAGSWIGAGNDPTYVKSVCFERFPFPAPSQANRDRIRKLAEELDAHRKRVQAQHPGLTLTGMYNVLEKLRANEALKAKEKQIHDAGLVSVLRQLHDDLDAAVFAAYGWPPTLTDAEILERLVALNAERAKEEASGLVRWLRPDYQNPCGARTQQTALAVEAEPESTPGKQRPGKLPWPSTLAERVKAVSTALATVKEPVAASKLAKRFARAKPADVAEILESLCVLGKARRGTGEDSYLP